MKTILSLFLLIPLLLFSQEVPKEAEIVEKTDTSEIIKYKTLDREAEFPGGVVAMKKYFNDNIEYSEIAIKNGDQGRVFLEFVVNKDGSIEGVEILRGVSEEIDNEAMRVIKNMPNWIPAEAYGEKIRARCRVPINFLIPHNHIFDAPDQYASFPGGPEKMKKHMSKKIKYPKKAMLNGDEGRVFVAFVVNKDGSIEEAKVLKSATEELDDEAIRYLNNMPKWIPAENNGEKVRSRCIMPINFILTESNK